MHGRFRHLQKTEETNTHCIIEFGHVYHFVSLRGRDKYTCIIEFGHLYHFVSLLTCNRSFVATIKVRHYR
jgi:hypothetical protein